MKIVRSYLNEELLDVYSSYFSPRIELYKNPKSIKRMGPWCRAITDQNGNFYISSADGETRQTISTSHTIMITRISRHENITTRWDGANSRNYINGIAWHRFGNTNKFYLAESYERELAAIEYVQHFIESLGNKFIKPIDAKFILKKIVERDYDLIK